MAALAQGPGGKAKGGCRRRCLATGKGELASFGLIPRKADAESFELVFVELRKRIRQQGPKACWWWVLAVVGRAHRFTELYVYLGAIGDAVRSKAPSDDREPAKSSSPNTVWV